MDVLSNREVEASFSRTQATKNEKEELTSNQVLAEKNYYQTLRLNKSGKKNVYHFLHSVICSRCTANHTFRVIRTADTHLIHYNYDGLVPVNWKPGYM